MPLPQSCSMKTFYDTVKIEKSKGKKLDQCLAIAYNHLKKVCGVTSEKRMTPSEIVAAGRGKQEAQEQNQTYPGMIDVEKILDFYKLSSSDNIKKFEGLLISGKLNEAVRLIENVLGVRFSASVKNNTIRFLEWLYEDDISKGRQRWIKNTLQEIENLVDSCKRTTFTSLGIKSGVESGIEIVETGEDRLGQIVIILINGDKYKYWVDSKKVIDRFLELMLECPDAAVNYLKRLAINYEKIV